MPKEIATRALKKIAAFPPDRTDAEKDADTILHLETGARLEIDNRGKDYVVHTVWDGRPKQILVISDWHLGSAVSDIKAMDEMRDYVLNNPDVLVIFAGDEMEGFSGGKYSHSIDSKTKLDAQQQTEFLRRRYLKPLAVAGRVLGMVSEYWGHPGWHSENTKNIWRDMVEGLDIDLIKNGGCVMFKYPKQSTEDMQMIRVWHNPPGAGKWDELSGQREVMQSISEDARPDGSVAGHIHRMQIASEVYAGGKRKVFYISAGTLKGTNPNMAPDIFGTYLGLSRPDPQGQGVTNIHKFGRREEMNIPFANLRQAKTTIDAVEMLNRAEQLGIRDEVVEKIYREVEERPRIEYPTGSNRLGEHYKEARPPRSVNIGGETVKNPYSSVEMRAPYSVLTMDVRAKLPIAIELISNARIGSTMEGYKDLQKHFEKVGNNSHRLVLFLRNMIDRNAGKSPDREEILEKFVEMVGRPGESINGQTIAVMMCESMRQDAWQKEKINGKKMRPIAPASYVASKTNIPLIHHLSLLKFYIGPGNGRKTIYPMVAADKAENSGSGTKPEWGLQVLYDKYIHDKPGVVVGTHMPNAGYATIYDRSNKYTNNPSLIAPGWWGGAVDSMGKGNVKRGAEPGQAVIFIPGFDQSDYSAFPTASVQETEYMLDGLTLLKGLELMEKKNPGITKRILGSF